MNPFAILNILRAYRIARYIQQSRQKAQSLTDNRTTQIPKRPRLDTPEMGQSPLPDVKPVKIRRLRTLLQDIRITILLGFAAGTLAGIVTIILGILTRSLFPKSWLPTIVILLLTLTFLDRQMIYRLNRIYLNHRISSHPDMILVGSLAAFSSAAGYIYFSSAAAGLYGVLVMRLSQLDSLYLTLCGPLIAIANLIQNGDLTAIVGWAIITGWLLVHACLYHPRLDHLAAAEHYQQ